MYSILISCHRDIYYATILDARVKAFIPLYSRSARLRGHCNVLSVDLGSYQSPQMFSNLLNHHFGKKLQSPVRPCVVINSLILIFFQFIVQCLKGLFAAIMGAAHRASVTLPFHLSLSGYLLACLHVKRFCSLSSKSLCFLVFIKH